MKLALARQLYSHIIFKPADVKDSSFRAGVKQVSKESAKGFSSFLEVLLLSSQRHSSGINLQMARHVVIVHPYCTPTATSQESISQPQMQAFEAQAIGRVRRYPQKKTVHVHRLFAMGSVEEELYARRRPQKRTKMDAR